MGEKDNSAEFGAFLQRESDCYEIPALTCLDAERDGPGPLFWDLTTTCSPAVMGATNDEDLVFEMGPPSLFGDELRTYLHAFTSGKEKTVGISFGYPYMHHFIMQGADAFINTYSHSAEMMKAVVEAIYGEIPFEGESPVDLNMKSA